MSNYLKFKSVLRIRAVFTITVFLGIQAPIGIVHDFLTLKGICAAKDITNIQKEYDKAIEKLKEFNNDHPLFRITGKVKNREEESVQIWGIAKPLNGDPNVFGTLWEESNIIVKNPYTDSITIDHYQGEHDLLGKQYGKNVFGVPVPVWVYGDNPERMRLQNLVDELQDKLKKWRQADLEQERLKQGNVEVKPEQLKLEMERLEQEKTVVRNILEEIKQEVFICRKNFIRASLVIEDSMKIVQETSKMVQQKFGSGEPKLIENLKKFQSLLDLEKLELEKNRQEFEQAELKIKRSQKILNQAKSRREIENAKPKFKELLEKIRYYRSELEKRIENSEESKEFFLKYPLNK